METFVETFVETFYKNTLDLLKNNGFFTPKIAKIKSENRCGTIKNEHFQGFSLKMPVGAGGGIRKFHIFRDILYLQGFSGFRGNFVETY